MSKDERAILRNMFAQSNTRLCVAQQLGKVEASVKRASNPAIREALLEFANALGEKAGLLTKSLRPSDAEVDQLAKRRTAKTKSPRQNSSPPRCNTSRQQPSERR